jgi:molybdate transport system substrate-binding protein
MRIIQFLSIILLLACNTSPQRNLTIAVAANSQYAIKELVDQFERQTGILVDIIPGSSGKLATQIIQGAPYDIFLSADMGYPLQVARKKGLDKPKNYAIGTLVFWSNNPNIKLSLIKSELDVDKIAIANPKIAPYGIAAVQALKNMKMEITLVYGESIAQVNHFVTTGAIDLGITSLSTVKNHDPDGNWLEIPGEFYAPIFQGAILLNEDKSAAKFYEFIFSANAQWILEKHGYQIP